MLCHLYLFIKYYIINSCVFLFFIEFGGYQTGIIVLEENGYFDGDYVKLSSKIQEVLSGEYKVAIKQVDRYGISE